MTPEDSTLVLLPPEEHHNVSQGTVSGSHLVTTTPTEDMLNTYAGLMHRYDTGTVLTFIVLVLGLVANIILLWSLLGITERRRSRLRPFLINLVIADLLVCCFTIAMELGWRVTVIWTAGDAACRFLSFTKTLGLYLEAFVVLAMSVDRCYVVLWPLKINGQIRRARILLGCAWVAAVVFSIPQAVVFHVEFHPDVPDFAQCVTLNSFQTPTAEKAYVIFGILAMYVIPLLMIIIISSILLWTIRSSSKSGHWALCRILTTSSHDSTRTEYNLRTSHSATNNDNGSCSSRSPSFRATHDISPAETGVNGELATTRAVVSTLRPLRARLPTGLQLYHTDTIIRKKARSRTLKLSMLIVLAFVLCYTPYAIMICVAFVQASTETINMEAAAAAADGSATATTEDTTLQDHNNLLTEALLMLSLSFSTIMNPLVYGSYMLHTRNCWRFIFRCFRKSPLSENGRIPSIL